MHDRLLARLGEQAVLRGTENCQANIERGVVVDYEPGDDKFQRSEFAAVVDIANLPAALNPKPGDTLVVGAESFVIDAVAANNGHLARCVLR
jgi:hypothetical protein